jgi:plasmid maintenance system antidote protein VapI
MSKHKKQATVSDALKAAVVASGQSINAVAVGAGVPQSALARFIAGERDLRLATADKLAAYLGLSLIKQ